MRKYGIRNSTRPNRQVTKNIRPSSPILDQIKNIRPSKNMELSAIVRNLEGRLIPQNPVGKVCVKQGFESCMLYAYSVG